MIKESVLREIDVAEEDIRFILEQNSIYGEQIEAFAKEYEQTLGQNPKVPYENYELRAAASQRAREYTEKVIALNEGKEYTLRLLAWLNLLPGQELRYKKHGIDRDVFISTARNLRYKINECKAWRGIVGTSTNYFSYDFDLKLFELGRLQFEAIEFRGNPYSFGDMEFKEGDHVYFCHIPSSGKLTYELCMDSFDRAYEFFKDHLDGTVLPVFCQSWLLYEPYAQKVYAEGSNLKMFSQLFDVYYNVNTEFGASWYVFGRKYEGTTDGLPADTSLRRNFINYINNGGDFGEGRGMLLYDGEKREIINRR